MKTKRFLLCLIMIFSCLCFASCSKDKSSGGEDNSVGTQKQEPTIVVNYELLEGLGALYVGTKLSAINICTVGEGTDGIIAWENPDYELVLGKNTCNWVFTPTDTNTYNSKTGSLELTAVNRLKKPSVDNITFTETDHVYGIEISQSAKFYSFSATCDGSDVQGTLSWLNPSQIVLNGENEYDWKFTPTKSDEFEVVTGKVKVNATIKISLESVSVYASKSTNLSGYVAFNEFNFLGLCLNYHLSGGIIIPMENINTAKLSVVSYQSGDTAESFRQGETKLNAKYYYDGDLYNYDEDGYDFEIILSEAVGYKGIEIPVYETEFSYDGYSRTLQIENTSWYTCSPVQGTDAGIYELPVTLIDTENCKWQNVNGDLIDDATVNIDCEILKADQFVSNNADNDLEYDGEAHQAIVTVRNNTATAIYYSQTLLNKDNYTNGETSISFVNAGTYEVYFYAVGKSNYSDLAGSFSFVIKRQNPTIELETCYTIKTNSPVNYPNSYVTIKNKNGNEIEKGELVISYYERYVENPGSDTPNIKTQPFSSGSLSEGSAPVNYKEGGYTVVVDFLGNTNYMPAKGIVTLYIDNDNLGLYAVSGESKFAFKKDADKDIVRLNVEYSIISTSEECINYIEFEKMQPDENGLIGISYISKFNYGDEGKGSGKLIYSSGLYKLLDSEGNLSEINIGENEVEVTLSDRDVTLSKWVIPSYADLKFTATTLSEEDYTLGVNQSCISEISFINDYGTIRFNLKLELKYTVVGENDGFGGYKEYSGLAEADLARTGDKDDGIQVIITCHVPSSTEPDYGASAEFFKIIWPVTSINNPTEVTISSLKVSDINSFSDSLTSITFNKVTE